MICIRDRDVDLFYLKNSVGFIMTNQVVFVCPISLSSLGDLFSSLHMDPVNSQSQLPDSSTHLWLLRVEFCPLEIHMLKS